MDYDQVASAYDQRYQHNDYSGVRAALLEFVSREKAVRVLEVGCGTGDWLGLLVGRGITVAGVDPSERMLACSREKLRDAEVVRGSERRRGCST
jgi:ubiquinone/menaquinone biosynthesis C-methylase UbiE